jgi:hypothetical protein
MEQSKNHSEDARQMVPSASAQEAEPIYQVQMADGSWIDQAEHKHRFNLQFVSNKVRIVYATPAPSASPAALTARQMVPSASAQEVEAVARAAVEQFKLALYQVPYFADRVNKATREKLSEAHSIVLNLPALLDQVNRAAPAPSASPAEPDVSEAMRLLAMMCDGYENGQPCYEDPEDGAGYIGNAFQISHEDFHAMCNLLNRRKAPRFDVRKDGLVVPEGKGASPADHSGDSADMVAPKDCQHGYGDVCAASARDGVVCPEDSCDIDDGIRTAEPARASRQDVALSESEPILFEQWVRPRNFTSVSEDAARLGWMARAALSRASSSRAEVERELLLNWIEEAVEYVAARLGRPR